MPHARRAIRAAGPQIYWGAWVQGSVYGSGYSNAPWDTNTWDMFESHAGKRMSIMHYGVGAWWDEPFSAYVADKVMARGAYVFLDMSTAGHTLVDIANGLYDDSIRTWAQDAAAWGKPFFFRLDGEMNGDWSDYGGEARANPSAFVAMWRHVYDVVKAAGATNVTWVWCPNVHYAGLTPMNQLYPGDAYVDWTALDGYNWGTSSGIATTWQTFYEVYKTSYDMILGFAPKKPMMIAEVASNDGGGSKAAWITDALRVQLPQNFPWVKAFVWFNYPILEHNVYQQWPIESQPDAQAAFKDEIRSVYYRPQITSFPTQKGVKVPLPR